MLPCDLEVMGPSHGNNLLQSRVRLRTINPSLRPTLAGASCTGCPIFFFLIMMGNC